MLQTLSRHPLIAVCWKYWNWKYFNWKIADNIVYACSDLNSKVQTSISEMALVISHLTSNLGWKYNSQ